MRCGLYVPNFGAFGDAEGVAALAARAERCGWDGLFLWDHIDRPGAPDVVDPWIALAAAALRSERLRLGALVTPIARRRPWKLARETVSLDRLSRGRLVFGAGLGSGRPEEWQTFGEADGPRERAARLDEGLEVLAGLWSGEPFSHQGRYYQVAETRFRPRPVQEPRIPVWIGGYWPNPAPFRRAARWDGAFPLFDRGAGDAVEQLAECVRFLRAERRSDAPFDVVHLASSRERDALPRAEAAGATWWLEPLAADSSSDAVLVQVEAGPPA